MSVSGLCEICEYPEVEETCERCGRLVCERHFDENAGVCVNCAAELGIGDEPVEPGNLPDDVDTYRF